MSAETTTTDRPTYVLARTEVRAVSRVSPNFVRVTFGGDELAEFATPGDVFDARIKLIFPPASGILPDLDRSTDDWWGSYLAVPEDERGSMRTYSVRELRVSDAGTEVDVDFVLHLAPGLSGPASRWADAAAVGQELFVIGPRRGRIGHGGAEYQPGTASSVVLAGDETAAPAIARILEDAPRDLRGVAFIEVPTDDDVLTIDAPAGVDVHWLPRAADQLHGLRLIPAVLGYLGDADADDEVEVTDIESEDLLWETPEYSGLGEEIAATDAAAERYFWIAGESGAVTTLRRHLVKDLGIDRGQVAFMGYWRRGVAMRGGAARGSRIGGDLRIGGPIPASGPPMCESPAQRVSPRRSIPVESFDDERPLMTQHTLELPEVDLVYDVHGPLPTADGRPPLLMIGQPMDASGFQAQVALFEDRTVVTYDPRGLGRSTRKDGRATNDPETQAEDVHALIEALDAGPVDMLASSGGAVTALALVTAHPHDVATLVAHEPPIDSVLPDAEAVHRARVAYTQAYQDRGWGAGMAAFVAMTSWEGEVTEEFLARPAPDPAAFGMPTEDDGRRDDPLLSELSWAVPLYEPDFEALKAAPTRIVVAVGEESLKVYTGRTAIAVAERLGQQATVFPSHHGGFMGGEFGYAGQPEAFAAKLRAVLDAG